MPSLLLRIRIQKIHVFDLWGYSVVAIWGREKVRQVKLKIILSVVKLFFQALNFFHIQG